MDPSYEVYLALYQAVSGTQEEKNVYKQFSRELFDLIVIDECHRGSAREDSAWREILEYFDSAIQLGMTATPKETKGVATLSYFGARGENHSGVCDLDVGRYGRRQCRTSLERSAARRRSSSASSPPDAPVASARRKRPARPLRSSRPPRR